MTDKSLIRRGASALDPGGRMDPLVRNVDRVFNSMVNSMFGPMSREESWLGDSNWVPAVDIRETDDAFMVSAELPGLSKKDVEVTLENNQLTISGERHWEDKDERETLRRVERGYGRFSRSFLLSGQVDPEKVKATFKAGVLEVEVPKSDEARPRRIAIG